MAKKPTVKTSAMSNLLDSLTVTLGGNYPSQFVRTEVMRVVREALKLHNATEAERDELARRLAEAENNACEWELDFYSAVAQENHWKARAEAAEAVVAKLPKTADGVPITPDMNLYSTIADYDFGCIAFRYEPDDFQIACRDVRGVDFELRAEQCYSTREAAEAAKEAPRD